MCGRMCGRMCRRMCRRTQSRPAPCAAAGGVRLDKRGACAGVTAAHSGRLILVLSLPYDGKTSGPNADPDTANSPPQRPSLGEAAGNSPQLLAVGRRRTKRSADKSPGRDEGPHRTIAALCEGAAFCRPYRDSRFRNHPSHSGVPHLKVWAITFRLSEAGNAMTRNGPFVRACAC